MLGGRAEEQGDHGGGALGEVAQPRGDVAAPGRAQQAESGVAEDGEDHRPGPEAELAAVLAEGNILGVVQPVLNGLP